MNLSDFLARLEGAKERKPGKWQAFCPAHENKNTPSLNITEKEFGRSKRILVYCMTGCTTDDVCNALGLTRDDLRDKPVSPELVISEKQRRARKMAEFYVHLNDLKNELTPVERETLVERVMGEILRGGR